MRHLHGFYESRLDLIDVDILNPYTNFECKSSFRLGLSRIFFKLSYFSDFFHQLGWKMEELEI